MGLEPAPSWLAGDGLLAMFAKRRSVAQQRYAQFVLEGIKADSPCDPVVRNAAIVAAHATGGYSYQQIADYFGMHFTTVGRIVWGGG